jgi:alpha-L-fucosidase
MVMSACQDEALQGGDDGGEIPPPPNIEEKMNWWNEARFGMIIHWGVYSGLAGQYSGQDNYGKQMHFQTRGNANTADADTLGNGAGSEWILFDGRIPRAAYRSYASLFTAENYDPQAIARLAKETGMKYIIMVIKHHEGFCLYDSQYTDWDVSASPAGARWNNDLVAPLAKAARDAGLKFGVYFAIYSDWMHTGSPGKVPELGPLRNPQNTDTWYYSYSDQQDYMQRYGYPMVREFLKRYNPDVIWWDGAWQTDNGEFAAVVDTLVRNYNPLIIQNDRLNAKFGVPYDYHTYEQSVNEDYLHGDAELSLSLSGSWGYSQYDAAYKKPNEVIFNLLRTTKLGANLLLNIGPKADGSIPEQNLSILSEVGAWMRQNGAAIYGTQRSPLVWNLPAGPTTYKEDGGDGRTHLYYHVFRWPTDGSLYIPGIFNASDKLTVSFLANGTPLSVQSVAGYGLRITGLPTTAPFAIATTIDIAFAETPQIEEGIRPINDLLVLDVFAARTNNMPFGNWNTVPDLCWYEGNASYRIVIPETDYYAVSAEIASFYKGKLTFTFTPFIDGQAATLIGSNTATPGGHANFQMQSIGSVHLVAGTYKLDVLTQQESSWLRLRQFQLRQAE